MKKLQTNFLLIILFIVQSVCWAGSQDKISANKYSITQQDRGQIAFENMVTTLRDLHGKIYQLPYDQEYIRTTIIPEVNANRASLAPHYPDRQTYGDSGEQAYQLLREWFETYPAETQAYIDFLRTYIASHSN